MIFCSGGVTLSWDELYLVVSLGWDATTPVVGGPADSLVAQSVLPEPPTTKAAEPSSYMSIWTQLTRGRAVSDVGVFKAVLRFLLLSLIIL